MSGCQTAGFQCEGYSEPSYTWIVRSSSFQDRFRRIQRGEAQASQTQPHSPAPNTNRSVSHQHVSPVSGEHRGDAMLSAPAMSFNAAPSNPYKTLEEQRAPRPFFEKAVPLMARFSDPECWSLTIPRIAWQQPTARNALIAVSLELGTSTNLVAFVTVRTMLL